MIYLIPSPWTTFKYPLPGLSVPLWKPTPQTMSLQVQGNLLLLIKDSFRDLDVTVRITVTSRFAVFSSLPSSNWPPTSPLCPPSPCLPFFGGLGPLPWKSLFISPLAGTSVFSARPSPSPETEMLLNVAAHYSLCLLDFNFPLCSSEFQLSSTTLSVISTWLSQILYFPFNKKLKDFPTPLSTASHQPQDSRFRVSGGQHPARTRKAQGKRRQKADGHETS